MKKILFTLGCFAALDTAMAVQPLSTSDDNNKAVVAPVKAEEPSPATSIEACDLNKVTQPKLIIEEDSEDEIPSQKTESTEAETSSDESEITQPKAPVAVRIHTPTAITEAAVVTEDDDKTLSEVDSDAPTQPIEIDKDKIKKIIDEVKAAEEEIPSKAVDAEKTAEPEEAVEEAKKSPSPKAEEEKPAEDSTEAEK